MSTAAPAYTAQDAAKLEASRLRLVHRKLAAVPPGIAALTSLTSLDLSENPLKQLQPEVLPCQLKELVMAGCQLSGTLPPSLTRLTALEQLVLSANSITQADAAFSCHNLVHAGLAYNHLTTLVSTPAGRSRSPRPSRNSTRSRAVSGASQALFSRSVSSTTAVSNHTSTSGRTLSPARSVTHAAVLGTSKSKRNTSAATSLSKSISSSAGSMRNPSTHPVLAASQIMCLDLSHNDISDLSSILQQLQQMPKLRALHLKGNPVSLLPQYRAAVLQQLPQLVYLDGQKLDDLRAMPAAPASAGQPSTSAPAAPSAAATAAAGQAAPLAAAAQKAAGTAPQTSAQAGATPPAAAPAAAAPVVSAAAAAVGKAEAEEAVQPANTVLITLELDKLQVSEPAADIFQSLTDRAIAKYQQLVHEQQQEQLAAATAAAAAAAAELQAGPSGCSIGQATAGRGFNSGSSPNTARSRASNAGGVNISSSGVDISSSGAALISGSGSAPSSTTCAGMAQLQPTVPLQPLRYHLEVWGPDGSGFCSAAVLVQPTAAAGESTPATGAAAATAASAADAKKGAAAKGGKVQDSKAALASKARPGSSVKQGGAKGAAAAALEVQQAAAAAAAAAEAAAVLHPGQLKVQMRVPADVATRDWLRTGFEVQLRRTQYQPQPVLPPPLDPQLSVQADAAAATATAAAPPPAATAAAAPSKAPGGHGASKSEAKTAQGTTSMSGSSQQAGRGKSSTGAATTAASEGAEAAGPIVVWQQVLQQDDLGTAKISAPALTESSRTAGQALESVGCVAFAPRALPMHPVSHIRLALTEAQHLQEQPAGSCVYKVVLHG